MKYKADSVIIGAYTEKENAMKTELIKMSDEALAARMAGYIDSAESLLVRCEYFAGLPCPEKELAEIRRDYSRLKASIREDAQYIAYTKQARTGSAVYETKFAPSVAGASAWGFTAPDDSLPGRELLESIEDGLGKLVSVFPADYWRILAQG